MPGLPWQNQGSFAEEEETNAFLNLASSLQNSFMIQHPSVSASMESPELTSFSKGIAAVGVVDDKGCEKIDKEKKV